MRACFSVWTELLLLLLLLLWLPVPVLRHGELRRRVCHASRTRRSSWFKYVVYGEYSSSSMIRVGCVVCYLHKKSGVCHVHPPALISYRLLLCAVVHLLHLLYLMLTRRTTTRDAHLKRALRVGMYRTVHCACQIQDHQEDPPRKTCTPVLVTLPPPPLEKKTGKEKGGFPRKPSKRAPKTENGENYLNVWY